MGKFTVTGTIPLGEVNALKATFAAIDKRMKPVFRRAVTKATSPLLKAMKTKLIGVIAVVDHEGNVLHDTGLVGQTGQMLKSLGRKVKSYPSGTVVGMVGPRTGFAIPIRPRERDSTVKRKDGSVAKKGETIMHDPAKIGHLVEFGHGGIHPAPPHPFARPAFEESKSEMTLILQAETASGLERVALAAASKIGA